mgnify:CR=1 FL=1
MSGNPHPITVLRTVLDDATTRLERTRFALAAARESIVLLANKNAVLPLRAPA